MANITVHKLVKDDIAIGFGQQATENAQTGINENKDKVGLHTWLDAVNVKHAGAVGDGVADDTAALQAVADSGLGMYVPTGTYIIDGSVTFTSQSDIHVFGEGQLKFKNGVTTGKQLLRFVSCSNVVVDGLTLDGNKANVATPPPLDNSWNSGAPRKNYTGIDLQSSTNIRIRRCEFRNFATVSINAENVQQLWVSNNWFHDSYMGAVFTITDTGNRFFRISGNLVERITYTFAYGNGFLINADDLTIDNNRIDTVDRSGIKPTDVAGITNVVIVGNIIQNATLHGINPQGGNRMLIANNLVYNCTQHGISVSPVGAAIPMTDVVVRGNQIQNCGSNGVNVVDCESLQISQNQIKAAGSWGIRVVSCDDITVQGNQIEDTVSHSIQVSTTGVTGAISRLQIMNNALLGGVDGIELIGEVQHCIMSGNVISAPSGRGIDCSLLTTHIARIVNNVIRGVTGNGIHDVNAGTIVDGNLVDGALTGFVLTSPVWGRGNMARNVTTFSTITGSIVESFADGDTTPSVKTGNVTYQTANTAPTTISAFDDMPQGVPMTVLINDAFTTIDFTGTSLKGNAGADWTPTTGDHLTMIKIGTNVYCQVSDNTV